MFGGRRATTVPLVREGFDWEHGVFLGSIMSSEMTAAAFGTVGKLRFDPFAMLPFCGYNMADYWAHWLSIGRKQGAKLPRIYLVNWFRKNAEGKFMWPGFGDNSRVIEWIFGRCSGESDAVETPIGFLPAPGALITDGLGIERGRHGRAAQGRSGRLGLRRRRPSKSTTPGSAPSCRPNWRPAWLPSRRPSPRSAVLSQAIGEIGPPGPISLFRVTRRTRAAPMICSDRVLRGGG